METITLKHPFPCEGGTLEEIQIRRAKVADVTKAKKNNKDASDQEIALIATLSGLPPAAIGELDMEDYNSIQAILSGFFG
jgi:hypothetical protein